MEMRPLFDFSKLQQVAEVHCEEYQKAEPFPNIALDGLANTDLLDEALEEFPDKDQIQWYAYDNPLERKLAMPHVEMLAPIFSEILLQMNSYPFLRFLERLTGVRDLIPDPTFNGGGLHQIPRGGKLDIHADYNCHPKFQLDRRLNVLLYLNKDWKEEYGGHFELWDKDMTRAEKKILPLFNRLAIFTTSDFSYHGHPDPLNCPEGRYRRSLALYYYTNGRPEEEKSQPHSTLFKRRPTDPDDAALDMLREKRAARRLENKTT